MAVALTEQERWHDSKRVHYVASVVFSGNYPTGGETVALQTLMKTGKTPFFVMALGQAGYVYQWDRTNNKLMVRQSAAAGSPLGELPAAAYPGGVTGDVIRLYAVARLV